MDDREVFYRYWEFLARSVHENAKSKGFYNIPREFGTSIALMHSELSEALEAYRNHYPMDNIAEEFADVIIRIMDTAHYMHLDVSKMLLEKIRINEGREYMHGGKRF